MEDIGFREKITACIKKYRYVILVCLIGIGLMILPGKEEQKAQVPSVTERTDASENTAEMLSDILKKLRGAGNVEVMLTIAAGEQRIYQTDTRGSSSDSGSLQIETVIITSSDKNQTGLITQVLPEVYLGAIILCQGADDPSVRLAITEAVSDVTGLSTDKISVLKMK